MPPALVIEVIAAVLDAGAPVAPAVGAVARALSSAQDPLAEEVESLAVRLADLGLGARAADSWRAGEGAAVPPGPAGRVTPVIEEALRIATRCGLPPAELVRRAAREQRRRAAVAHSRATRRLEVRLVLPAGLCLLPAFVLVGVVPVIIDLLGG